MPAPFLPEDELADQLAPLDEVDLHEDDEVRDREEADLRHLQMVLRNMATYESANVVAKRWLAVSRHSLLLLL
ncbi:hypothetical protein [Brevundimonas sp. Leaf168]|uniref:hypothetical protein n=1 Tax=Brevundimonas sp. Leaf168 TaxID=1736283 RepID=UPI0012E32A6B|nr:hypothetical protein [Brevundimonas sp. Leaf168]